MIITPANSRKRFVLSSEDRDLIDRVVSKLDGYSPERAAAAIPGVSGATLRRYMDGEYPSRMTTTVRVSLRKFVKTAGAVRESAASPYGLDLSQDEQWLQSLMLPDSLRRMARTVEGRSVIKGLRGIIADLEEWPTEKKRAADRLLSDALLDEEPPQS